MNNIVLVGRLTANPEVRYIAGTGTAVAQFTLAVDREFLDKSGKRGVDFIDIQVWNKQAETCEQYLKKGNMACVQGSLRVESYVDNNGINRRSCRVNASRVQFLTPKNNSNSESPKEDTPVFEPNFEVDLPDGFSAIEDDMPF